MALENRWGAPRILGELTKLGIKVCETTVGRYMPRKPAGPAQVQRWITFFRNHKDAIAAMDFITVPTPWFAPVGRQISADPVLHRPHPEIAVPLPESRAFGRSS